MDTKLKDAIEAGVAALDRITDGVHYVRDTATNKVYQWVDGHAEEVEEVKQQVVAPVVKAGQDLKELAIKRGLGGLFK